MITKQQSGVISIIRLVAMLSIVLCHLLQAYGDKWAWVFNIGVQIFLAISGWLYGKKYIINWKYWFKDKLFKLYVPYVIYLVAIFIIYRFLSINTFSFSSLLYYLIDLQWILGGVDGLSHLWFLTAIGICYTLTPILQYIREKGHSIPILFILSIAILLNILFLEVYLDQFACLFIYIFCFLFASIKPKYERIYTYCTLGVFICTLAYLNWNVILDYSNGINKLFHITLGILFVIIPTTLSYKFSTIRVPALIKIFDKYSYYIYITHHVFILGPLSLAYLYDNCAYNIVLIILLTVVSAIVLRNISKIVISLF